MRASVTTSRRAALRGRYAVAGAAVVLLLAFLGVTAFAVRSPAAAATAAQNQPQSPSAPAPRSARNKEQLHDAAKTPENVKPLPLNEAAPVLGKKVNGPNGEDLGLIVDVLIDADGRPRAAVIDFGGFLGVGSRKIAIDWKALDFTPLQRTGAAELGLDRAQIAAAPEYKAGAPGAAVMTTPPGPPPVDSQK